MSPLVATTRHPTFTSRAARRTPLAPPSCRAWAWGPPLLILFAVLFALAAMLVVFRVAGLPRIHILTLALAALIGLPISIGLALHRQRLARVRAHWYRICPHCNHDLRLLGDHGQCPSCTRPFNPDTLIKHWERASPKVARAKRWRPISARGPLPPSLLHSVAPPLVAALLAGTLTWLHLLPSHFAGLAFLIVGPGFALLQPLILKRDRQDLDNLQACNFLICPECLSSLPSPSDPTRGSACCFTCGQQYTSPWLAETWALTYPHLKAPLRHGAFQSSRLVRRMTIAFGLACLVLALLYTTITRFAPFVIPRSVTIALISLAALGLLAYTGFIVSRINYHHTRMLRLRALDYRFCPECAYDLRDAPPSGTCSECGTPFTPASLRERWEADPKVDPPPMDT